MRERITVSSLAAFALLAIAAFVPAHWLDHLAACPMKAATGLACPGCGLSHAMIAAGHFDLTEAWRAHPGVFVVIPLLLLFAFEPWIRPRVAAITISRTIRWTGAATGLGLLAVWASRIAPIATAAG